MCFWGIIYSDPGIEFRQSCGSRPRLQWLGASALRRPAKPRWRMLGRQVELVVESVVVAVAVWARVVAVVWAARLLPSELKHDWRHHSPYPDQAPR